MKSEIRLDCKGYYRVYTEDYETVKKVTSWQGCKKSCTYHNQKGQVFGWDLILPAKLYNRVVRLVDLPKKSKDTALVESGKKAAERNCQHQFKG